ncbi:MAG: 16S rRNA (guanine(966)-N(2))-methyltransferase RsmD [Micrococcales bacterium]
MTRIIGGIAGSRKLVSPAKSTRPTSDRIRESIFNRLESRDLVSDAEVLDLYAGTGALALEALSRGAKNAVLVENNRQAAAVCEQNSKLVVKALDSERVFVQFRVFIQPVKNFLASDGKTYDLVFIDPPYEVTNEEITQNLEALVSHLKPAATVVVERSSRSGEPEIPSAYELAETKGYGDTNVFWLNVR